MPHTLVLAEARQAEVSRMVREVLEARGALLDEQTHSHTVFEGLRRGSGFRRGGYVGAYQPVGERTIEVVTQAWATLPRRLFWGAAVLEFLLVVALFAASPPSAVFFLAALVLWVAISLAGLVFYVTFRESMAVEDELHQALGQRFREEGLTVLDEQQLLERRIREKLEGEAKERELASLPPPPRKRAARPTPESRKGPLFGRKPKG